MLLLTRAPSASRTAASAYATCRAIRTTSPRTVMEVTVLVCGVVLGGTAGFGTVLFAFAFGPLVQVTLGWFGAPRLAEEPVGLAGE